MKRINSTQTDPANQNKQHRNFTLIELLVVVAVIAILSGILLPALNKARNRAHSLKCLNNQKSLITAFSQYNLDFNGYIPLCNGFKGKSKSGDVCPDMGAFWQVVISPYLGYRLRAWEWGNADSCKDARVTLAYLDDRSKKVYQCPVSAYDTEQRGLGYSSKFLDSYAHSMAYNLDTFYAKNGHINEIRGKSPSQVLMYGPNNGNQFLYDYSKKYDRHVGGINVSWVDGHVSYVKDSFMHTDPQGKNGLFWFLLTN